MPNEPERVPDHTTQRDWTSRTKQHREPSGTWALREDDEMRKAKSWSELHHKRWNNFSLAELQILQQGLWIIGEQARVDNAVINDFVQLRNEVKVACSNLSTPSLPE